MVRKVLIFLLLGLLTAPSILGARGVVQTHDGWHTGTIRFGASGLKVDGKNIPWKSVVLVRFDSDSRTLPMPNRVQLQNGDILVARIDGWTNGKLKFKGAVLGEHSLPSDNLSSVQFKPEAELKDPGQNTLYRRGKEPVPGKLLSLDSEKVTLNTLIGKLSFPRRKLTRYVFSPAAHSTSSGFEITFVDGSTLIASDLDIVDHSIKLHHPILKSFTASFTTIRHLRRTGPRCTWLDDPDDWRITTLPLFERSVSSEVSVRESDHTWGSALEIPVLTRIQIELPDNAARLTGVLLPAGTNHHPVRAVVMDGDHKLYDQQLTPDGTAKKLSLNLSSSGPLTVEIQPTEQFSFPAGVILADPCILKR